MAEHLEGELRDAVAECLERHVVEDDVGDAAVSRRIPRTHLAFDERVGRLGFGALVDAPDRALDLEFLAIGPDAAKAGNRPFADGNGDVAEIQILGGLRASAPAFAAP